MFCRPVEELQLTKERRRRVHQTGEFESVNDSVKEENVSVSS